MQQYQEISPNYICLFMASHPGQPLATLSTVVGRTLNRRDWCHHCRGFGLVFYFEGALLLSFLRANGLWCAEVTCQGILCCVL